MDWQSKRKVIIINAFIMAALFGLISFNKEFLRPTFNDSDLLNALTGCFPNFIAAFLISLAIVSPVLLRKLKRGRLIVYLSSTAIFIILTVEEFNPMWEASTYYDSYDIIASGVGSLLAIIVFELLLLFQKRKQIKT